MSRMLTIVTVLTVMTYILYGVNGSRRGSSRGSSNSCSKDIGNGCSSDDMNWFINLGSQFPDLVTQSEGINSQELIDFAECNFLVDATYSIIDQDSRVVVLPYNSRDEILYGNPALGWSAGLVADASAVTNGRIWLWSGSGFATCDCNSANYTFRSGDNARANDGTNSQFLSRSTYSFVKVDDDDDDDGSSSSSASGSGSGSQDSSDACQRNGQPNCSDKWKVSNVLIEAIFDPFNVYENEE